MVNILSKNYHYLIFSTFCVFSVLSGRIRVKRRGKSPPRRRQRRRQDTDFFGKGRSFAYGKTSSRFPAKPEKGKPHQEQSQICAPATRRLSAGRLQKKGPETALSDRWQNPKACFWEQNPAYGSSLIFYFDFAILQNQY